MPNCARPAAIVGRGRAAIDRLRVPTDWILRVLEDAVAESDAKVTESDAKAAKSGK